MHTDTKQRHRKLSESGDR